MLDTCGINLDNFYRASCIDILEMESTMDVK